MPAITLAPDSNSLLIGKGEAYFDRYSATPAKQGYFHLGNAEKYELTTEDDTVEKKSSMSAAVPTYKKVARARTVKLAITGTEFELDNVALLTAGDTNEQTQTASAVTGESLTTSVVKGRYYRIAKYGPISAVAVKQGMTTLVLNTDYKIVDATLGIIQILQSSVTVTNGSAITIDYTPTAYSAGTGIQTVRGGTKTLIEGGFMFDPDPTVGPKMSTLIWRAQVSPAAGFSLLSEDFQSWELEATLLDDSAGLFGGTASEPLYRVSYLP